MYFIVLYLQLSLEQDQFTDTNAMNRKDIVLFSLNSSYKNGDNVDSYSKVE